MYSGRPLLLDSVTHEDLAALRDFMLTEHSLFTPSGTARRTVTTVNPRTGASEQHPICDVASSHMARRTFIGNLYKKVKDPNLVGKLSGHCEGSRTFSRYRDIDDEMLREMTGLLD